MNKDKRHNIEIHEIEGIQLRWLRHIMRREDRSLTKKFTTGYPLIKNQSFERPKSKDSILSYLEKIISQIEIERILNNEKKKLYLWIEHI